MKIEEKRLLGLKRKTYESILLILLVMFSTLILVEVKREKQPDTFVEQAHAQIILSPTPTPTQKEMVLAKPHGDILWRIYGNESSFGKNPFWYCQQKGLFNDFGYNVLHKQCFQTFDQELNNVASWFETKLKTLTLGQALCLYNTGIAYDSCRYSEDFLNL